MHLRRLTVFIIILFATNSYASHVRVFAPNSVTLDFSKHKLMDFSHVKVTATRDNKKLIALSIEIDEKIIQAKEKVLEGITHPKLSSLGLGRSAGFTFGAPISSSELIIFLDYGECVENTDECSSVSFFVDNGRFISRERRIPLNDGTASFYFDEY